MLASSFSAFVRDERPLDSVWLRSPRLIKSRFIATVVALDAEQASSVQEAPTAVIPTTGTAASSHAPQANLPGATFLIALIPFPVPDFFADTARPCSLCFRVETM